MCLVDLGLGQAGDLLGTILNLAVGKLESAEDTGALLDGIVASQLVVCNAVQSAVAWEDCMLVWLRQYRSRMFIRFRLTASWASGHALAGGTVDSASILLERLVGDAASTIGSLAGVELAASDAVNTLNIGDGGRREGNKAKENGGERELHFD